MGVEMSEDTHSDEYIKKLEAEISRLEEYIHCHEVCKWRRGLPDQYGWYLIGEGIMVRYYVSMDCKEMVFDAWGECHHEAHKFAHNTFYGPLKPPHKEQYYES